LEVEQEEAPAKIEIDREVRIHGHGAARKLNVT
jgi:hypothetical protein